MEAKQSRTKYWIYFSLWAATIIFIIATPSIRQWFWLALPGTATYLALGMDLI